MRKIIINTVILTASNIITRSMSFLFFILLARALEVSEYGLFRYLLSISMIYSISFTGFTTAMTRYIGANKLNQKKIKEYMNNGIVISFLIFLIVLVAILLFEDNGMYLGLLFFAAFIDFLYTGIISGLLNYYKMSTFKLVENIIQLIILVVSFFVFKYFNLTYAIIFYAFSGITSVIILEKIKPEIQLKMNVSKKRISELAKYAVQVTPGAVGWVVMFGINAIFIKHFYSTVEVGYYSAGITLVQIFTFLPAAISAILMPKIAGLKDKSKIIKPLFFTIFGSALISIILLILLLQFKSFIIETVFTSKYDSTVTVLLPLAIGQIAISLYQIYASVWHGLNKPIIPSIIIIISCILNIIGSYFLTKNYGIIGAAISNAISASISLIITMIVFQTKWKTLSKNKDLKNL